MLLGNVTDLQQPDSIIIDELGHDLLWPHQPLQVGREITLNERRAVVVGICRASLTFQTLPVCYTRRSQATHFLPPERNSVSAILVKEVTGLPLEEVCQRIHTATGLLALTQNAWAWRTIDHYLTRTGILLNFATTIGLGFLVGVAVCGQTFYTFTLENLPQLAMLKAMGTSNGRLAGMILLQAAVVGLMGYGLGVGLAAIFGELSKGHSKLVFFMPWQVLVITGLAVVVVTMLASLLSIRRVLRLEPAIVVR
jgi:putative ABC transport system permease protein